MNTIAERLKWARDRLSLSQEQLADKAGVSQGTIGNIESGARKSPRELLAIAEAVAVRPAWLKDGKGNAEIPQAHDLSLARKTISPQRILWGDLMKKLPELFELDVLDDAMAPLLNKGDIARFSTTKVREAGKPVLVVDSDGRAYIRDFIAGRGEDFTAQARNSGYQPMESRRDGLRVLAVLAGVDWA